MQREEQRLKKEKEKNFFRQPETVTNTAAATEAWADRFSNYKPTALPDQGPVAPPTQTAVDEAAARVCSAPMATVSALGTTEPQPG